MQVSCPEEHSTSSWPDVQYGFRTSVTMRRLSVVTAWSIPSRTVHMLHRRHRTDAEPLMSVNAHRSKRPSSILAFPFFISVYLTFQGNI
ncbi:hypothetical protein T4C_6447 [Trichinella pseudospiralis]|uniref:Uncharacterized protein n=1 Tax=Trichinella pseudospiralis TaxID=6337 RepID=A0A0V1JKK9_TRIPS|nr:hypothetical protein T4D_4123 [Trichinella pseudospiralis]KRZ35466.1 hypothetical protein T4C_6447 [Trichinella pseudospiralis]